MDKTVIILIIVGTLAFGGLIFTTMYPEIVVDEQLEKEIGDGYFKIKVGDTGDTPDIYNVYTEDGECAGVYLIDVNCFECPFEPVVRQLKNFQACEPIT